MDANMSSFIEADFMVEVRKIAPGGVHVVYDGVEDTFERSLALLKMFGKAINYGNASGEAATYSSL
jgi:NADPH:quinone reductase-like Zn-dependent oxidoreductase